MNKRIFLILSLLVMTTVAVLSAELTKTDLSVAYWYYSYYEPGRIEKPPIKWETPDTLSPVSSDSLTKNSNMYGSDSTNADSTALEFEKTKSESGQYGKIEYMTMPAHNAVFLLDSIPYIDIRIYFNGDEKDLQAIGVLVIRPRDSARCIMATCPLSHLPKLEAVAGVSRIAAAHVDYITY